MRFSLITLAGLSIALSCTAQKGITHGSVRLDEHHILLLLDSTDAAFTLLQDPTDLFFERITASEMSIQMKQALKPGQQREDILPAFNEFLRRDVESFTADESDRVSQVFREVFKSCNGVFPGGFPDTLKLIKTKGNHYGPSVYYTRMNGIVIPSNVLGPEDRQDFTSTMYHELFHVFSRLHPEKSRALYKLIGFEHLGLENLQIPDGLAARVLFNPDGVDFAQKIELKTPAGNAIQAIPVIYANHLGYTPGKDEFFGYVEFNLYQIEKSGPSTWKVLTQNDGYSSTLDLKQLPDFFKQIKDNTGYIIHPDEILADNFSFLIQGKNNTKITARFSDAGKQLLTDIEQELNKP